MLTEVDILTGKLNPIRGEFWPLQRFYRCGVLPFHLFSNFKISLWSDAVAVDQTKTTTDVSGLFLYILSGEKFHKTSVSYGTEGTWRQLGEGNISCINRVLVLSSGYISWPQSGAEVLKSGRGAWAE